MAQHGADYPLDYTRGPATERSSPEKAADAATGQLNKVSGSAMDTADRVVHQARYYGEKAQDATRNFKPFVEKSLKDQPMSTLAAAAALGFVLGALWKK